jgi:ribosome maturation factor RimP
VVEMQVNQAALVDLCSHVLDGLGYELVELEFRRERQGWVLRVFIDRQDHEDRRQSPPGTAGMEVVGEVASGVAASEAASSPRPGIGLDDCTRVSHELSAHLDVEDLIAVAYVLEVSSPGVNRPLRWERDFARFAGRRARVRLAAALAGRRNFVGKLAGAAAGQVRIDVDGTLFELPLGEVQKANLEEDF